MNEEIINKIEQKAGYRTILCERRYFRNDDEWYCFLEQCGISEYCSDIEEITLNIGAVEITDTI